MGKSERGFTLAEVLAALAIMGMVISLAAQTMIWESRINTRGQMQIETHQAVRASMTVIEREIRQAKSVSLLSPGKLHITRSNNQTVYLYVDDKDFNGIRDLYMETDGIPNPVASYVEEVDFLQQAPGKWEVLIVARQGGVENRWQLTVKQRVN